MNKTLLVLFITVILISCASNAKAATLYFDEFDLKNSYKRLNALDKNYGGFGWSSFSNLIDKDYKKNVPGHVDNGYNKGAVSGENSFFNGYSNDITITRNEIFDFVGAYFTSAAFGAYNVTLFGYQEDGNILMKKLDLNTDATPKYFNVDFKGIEKLTIESSNIFVMDNFEYNTITPVPEPSSFLLGLLGIGGLFGIKKRK